MPVFARVGDKSLCPARRLAVDHTMRANTYLALGAGLSQFELNR